MTHRIEPLFLNMTPRIELHSFFVNIWIFLTKILFFIWLRFEPFSTWLRENEPDWVQNLTQRIEPSSQKDSKNWTLKDYLIHSSQQNFPMTRGIELFFVFESKKLSFLFSNLWFKLLDLFWTELTELNTFKNMTRRTGHFWKNMTHRNWTLLFNMSQRKWLHFWSWLKEYFFFNIRLKEQWFCFGNSDPKNWTFLKKHIWLWELNLFFTKSKNWSFFTNMTHSKNSSLLNLFIWLKELNSFLNMTQRIGLVSKWLKELNLFLKMTQKFCSLDLTQNWFFWLWLSERYCFVYFDSNNWTVFKIRPKGLNFFDWLINMIQRIVFSLMSHRIEHFFEHERIEPSFFMTQRIEPIFLERLNWTLFRSKELNILFEYDSQNWTLFWNVTQRIEPSFHKWLEDLNFLLQICLIEITFFWKKKKKDDSKNWFSENINQIIQTLFWWLKELSFFLTNMTHGTEPFFPCDSRNWTLLSNMTHSNWILLFFDMTQRIEPFLEYDSKSWKIFMSFWLKELNLFWIWLENLNFFLECDSQNWIFYDSKNWVFFSMTKILLNTTQRIEPLFEYVP